MSRFGQLHIDQLGTMALISEPKIAIDECEFNLPKQHYAKLDKMFGNEIAVYYWHGELQFYFKGRITQISRDYATGQLVIRVRRVPAGLRVELSMDEVAADLVRRKLTR